MSVLPNVGAAQEVTYLDVDLHRKVSDAVVLDEAGEVVRSRHFAKDRSAFLRASGELEPEPISVAFEETDGWSRFADLLAGWPFVMESR